MRTQLNLSFGTTIFITIEIVVLSWIPFAITGGERMKTINQENDYWIEGTKEFQEQYEERDEEVYGMNEYNQSFCPEINKKLIDFSIDNAKSNIIMLLWLQEILQNLTRSVIKFIMNS